MKQTYEVPTQKITLPTIDGHERIIDIGAGSEALLSRVANRRVCAVDISMLKIREAQIYDSGADWILCDAQSLSIQDDQFSFAGLWFSLDYMPEYEKKKRVLRETYRVLRIGGLISILSARIECKEKKFHFRVQYTFPDGTVTKMGYLVRGGQNQTLEQVCNLLILCGYHIIACKDNHHYFSITAKK